MGRQDPTLPEPVWASHQGLTLQLIPELVAGMAFFGGETPHFYAAHRPPEHGMAGSWT